MLSYLLAVLMTASQVAPQGPVPVVSHVTTPRRAVALTVNDGPDGRVTPMILRLLKEHGAHATFFVSGEAVRDDPQMLLEIRDSGSEVANHAYHHRALAGRPYREVADELRKTQALMAAAYPAETVFLRPPFGAVDKTVLRAARASRLRVVLAGVGGDVEVLHRVPKKLQPGDIVAIRDDMQGLRQLREILRLLDQEHIEGDSLGLLLAQR